MELKDKLIQLRKENKMTQADLADALNISRQAVSRWETGVAIPSTENLVELSKLFGVSVDVILDNAGIKGKATEESTIEKAPEQSRQSKRWQNKKLVAIALVIAIITAVIGAAIGILQARERDIVRIEDVNEDSYVNPEKVDIINIEES